MADISLQALKSKVLIRCPLTQTGCGGWYTNSGEATGEADAGERDPHPHRYLCGGVSTTGTQCTQPVSRSGFYPQQVLYHLQGVTVEMGNVE